MKANGFNKTESYYPGDFIDIGPENLTQTIRLQTITPCVKADLTDLKLSFNPNTCTFEEKDEEILPLY